MAKTPKKTSKTKTDADINLDDLDDLGDLGEDMTFGDEEGLDDENRNPSRAKVLTDLGRQAGEGALEEVIKNTAKKALPEEYSANYHEAMDIANFTSEVVSKNKQALNKSSYRLGKEVKKILPFKVGLLDKYLESQQSQFESFKSQTEEQLREAGIASETASIFDKQLDVQKSLYARTEAQNEVDGRERLVQNKLSQDVLTNMDGNIAHQTAFMTQISKEYYKRSLELQYKSFYVQADSLKTMREYYKAFTIQFTNIEKNTSLPDFVKLRNTEALQELLRTQTVQSVYGNLVGNNKYLASMKKKMAGYVDEKVQGVTNAMDDMTGMLEMTNSASEGGGGSSMGMLAGIGASMAGTTLGGKIADKISPQLKEKLKNNRALNTGANYMGMLGASPSSLLESIKTQVDKKKEESADEATPGRYINSKIFGGIANFLQAGTPDGGDYEVTQKGYLTHNQPAIFDSKVHRSITEVIPLYLARILQSSSDMVSMYGVVHKRVKGIKPNNGLLMYDYDARTLGSQASIETNIQQKVMKEKSVANRSKDLSKSILSDAGSTASRSGMAKKDVNKLKTQLGSKESNALLAGYIEQATQVTGENMDFDTLFKNYDQEGNKPLKDLVDKDPKLKALVEAIKQNAPSSTTLTDGRMKDLTRNYPLEGLKHLFKMVSTLARSTEPHLLKNKSAESLSRAFANYLLKSGKDVTPPSVVDKSCFMYLLAEDATEEVLESISVLVHDVRKLLGTRDDQIISSMELLFALMNRGLREGQDIDPSVFQSLAELYPEIVSRGKLNATNTREGSLRVGDASQYVDNAKLIDAGNRLPPAPEADNEVTPTLIDGMLERAKTQGNNAANFLRENRDDPSAAVDKIVNKLRSTKSVVSEALVKKMATVRTDIANFNNAHGIGVNALKGRAFVKLINTYDTFTAKMESIVSDMEKELKEKSDAINAAQAELNAAAEGEASPIEVGKLTQGYQAATRQSITLLNATIATLKEQRKGLIELSQDSGPNTHDRMSQMRYVLKKGYNSINTALESYRLAGKDLFNAT